MSINSTNNALWEVFIWFTVTFMAVCWPKLSYKNLKHASAKQKNDSEILKKQVVCSFLAIVDEVL